MRKWLSALDSADEDPPEFEPGEEVASKITGLYAGVANDEVIMVGCSEFGEALVCEVWLHGTTTRSFTASRAAETHKSERTQSQV
jgi:hypothetical protein